MRLIFTDCRVHQLSVPIAAICVLCGQIFMFMFVVSGNCIIFAMNSVATAVVLEVSYRKGVIEIIFISEILAKFDLERR